MAAGQIHVNPQTGEPGKCRANVKCPYGDDAPHFEHERDARLYFEIAMEDGEEQGRKVFRVVDAARAFRRAEEKIEMAKSIKARNLDWRVAEWVKSQGAADVDSSIVQLESQRDEALAALKADGLRPEQVIDVEKHKLKTVKDIHKLVTEGKPVYESYLDRKEETWNQRLEKINNTVGYSDKTARDRALFNLKLSVIRELPTKRILEHEGMSRALDSDFLAGRGQRIAQAIPGIGEASSNRRGASIEPGRTGDFNRSALDRAAQFISTLK